jgi:hypothetical protein
VAKINASFTKSPYVPRFKRNYERGLVKVVGDGREKARKMPERLLLLGFRRLRNRRDFRGESLGHLAIAFTFGDFLTVIQGFECARNFTFAEEHADLAKDTRVTLSFFGGIHDGDIQRRNS